MIKKTVVLYPGRFQPFGKHHAATFLWIQKQFPDADAFIVTSNVTGDKSPFNFNEKKAIISAYDMAKYVKKVSDPYKAVEVISKYDPKTTAVVFVVGKKDSDRITSGKFFKPYPKDGENLNPVTKNGYIAIAPHISLNVPGYGEMSGTAIRNSLGDPKKTKDQKKKLFNGIFGWYSDKLANMIIKKLTALNEDIIPGGKGDSLSIKDVDANELEMGIKHEMEHTKDANVAKEIAMDHLSEDPHYYTHLKSAGIDETKLFSPNWWKEMLIEGGAAGHMAHVFDLPQVKTGKDLLKVFSETAKSLQETPAAVKIDGVNTTLKIVKRDGKTQFALDRGSMSELDVKGITVNDLGSRFAAGHGMLILGKKVLEAFNACLPKITSELNQLGMLKDPNILMNVETVIGDESGKTNVIAYKDNFFVIHGLLKSKNSKDIRERREQSEISGHNEAINALVEKCKPIMQKLGYGIYGTIPTKVKSKFNFNEAINTPLTVLYNKRKQETKSLKDWLAKAVNPKSEKIKYSNGKTDSAMSKKNYMAILNRTIPLDTLTANPADQKKLIDGAVFYHATRLLGTEILDKLDSDVGNVSEHEGIVIRDPKISDTPFKVVGEFIVSGLSSGFSKK